MQPKERDEYNWPNYTQEYAAQLVQVEKENDLFIKSVWADRESGNIQFYDKIHPNWAAIYSILYRLNPKSVFEVGCGNMMHLVNLKKILPRADFYGCDLLETQINLGKEKYKVPSFIYNNVMVTDFTKEFIETKFDAVYSHAVLMHMSTDNAIAALRNMERIAKKNIILVEGVANHYQWHQMVKDNMPEFDFELTSKYIDYGILLTRKPVEMGEIDEVNEQ